MSCNPTYKGIRYNSIEELKAANKVNNLNSPETIREFKEFVSKQSGNTETFSDVQIEAMIQSGEITFTEDDGKPCAKMGMKSDKFAKGGKWEMIKEFKGASHERGGIDIEIGNGGIKMSGKQGKFEAKFGLVIAANGFVASASAGIAKMGGSINKSNIDMYSNYITGNVVDNSEEIKNYDKLNRIYYSKSKELGMSPANYIMTHIVGNS
jgi:cyclophilin family peptidyl-prolyl cis-trans isomerase